jgi:mannose-1-phosphate guanylyltransferase
MQDFINGKLSYSELENISIDYAVMEKSSNISLIPAAFEWYDVGNLSVFLSLKNRFEKSAESVVNVDGNNNLASTTKKVVVCIGVDDLCIVETESVILITKNDSAENVKKAFPKIKELYKAEL